MSEKKTVLVTGASRGIGLTTARFLEASGYRVLALARNPRADVGEPLELDLSDLTQIYKRLSEVLRGSDLHAVVSNAGAPCFGNLEEQSPEQIRAAIDMNLTSHLMVVRATLPFLKRQESSTIVLTGSEAALRGGRRGTLYCAAKFGLRGFAQALREECAASGVRVTLVNPGMVRTEWFKGLDFAPGEQPEQAIEPQDVAECIRSAIESRRGTVIDEINLSPQKRVVRKKPDSRS